MHVHLLPRQARALPQVSPLDPHRRREAHQVGPGPPQQADGRPLRAAVPEADHAEEEGLPLPPEVDVRGARCSLAAWRGVVVVWSDDDVGCIFVYFPCVSRCVSGVVCVARAETGEEKGRRSKYTADGVAGVRRIA